tara:strand:- start:184 stop:459 length:276 start_codon:yes stop_codon:yes gene_type:complete
VISNVTVPTTSPSKRTTYDVEILSVLGVLLAIGGSYACLKRIQENEKQLVDGLVDGGGGEGVVDEENQKSVSTGQPVVKKEIELSESVAQI